MYYIKRLINKIASAQIIIALVAHLLEDGHTPEQFVFSSDRPILFHPKPHRSDTKQGCELFWKTVGRSGNKLLSVGYLTCCAITLLVWISINKTLSNGFLIYKKTLIVIV